MRREQGESAPTIVQSISETLAGVKRTFELRHIICHEAHYYMAIQTDEVKNLCSCCYNFALASYHGIGFHQNPNAPLTLAEAYEAVSARVLVLENEINTVEAHIISKMDIQMQKRFDAIRQAWKTYLDREAEFNSSLHMNGNRGELYAQLTIESLYNKRLLELKKYARQIDIFP
jgi:hypothetical protein